MAITTRKRNPQDSTLRNIRALKVRVSKLEKDVRMLMGAKAASKLGTPKWPREE